MRTNVYIDGFNLYYGALRGSPYRWLDIVALSKRLLPHDDIQRVRYFTARIRASESDPQKHIRQQTYLRALQTLPGVTLHEGTFLRHPARLPLVAPPAQGPSKALVYREEEKGSDVNLATLLLCDAFDRDYEAAVIISNDSDLVLPIQVIRERFGLVVGVYNPQRRPGALLKAVASFYRSIHASDLAASQLPGTLRDAHGTITKPASW